MFLQQHYDVNEQDIFSLMSDQNIQKMWLCFTSLQQFRGVLGFHQPYLGGGMQLA